MFIKVQICKVHFKNFILQIADFLFEMCEIAIKALIIGYWHGV